MGLRVKNLGFRVWGLGFRVCGLGFRVEGSQGSARTNGRRLGVSWLPFRFRAKREQPKRIQELLPESHDQNLALTVLYVPHVIKEKQGC